MGNLSGLISEERKKLEATIEANRAQIRAANEAIREADDRLTKLKQLEELHNQLFTAVSVVPSTGELKLSMAPAHISADVAAEGQSKKDRIVGTVERILMDGRRRTTKELLAELSQQGVDVGGQDPVNNLAAYLSPQKEKFNSDRKLGGWGLNHPKKGSPDDASPPSGLRLNGASRFPHAA